MSSGRLITVVGSLNMDLITRASRIPAPGETLTAQSFDTSPGGKGANQAVACARLSRSRIDPALGQEPVRAQGLAVRVKMVGAVGDDGFGRSLITSLSRDGIDVSGVGTRPDRATGIACVIVEAETGENRILLSPNANYAWAPEQFLDFPSPPPDLIVLQLEIPSEVVHQILLTANWLGIKVLLNPAPAAFLLDDAFRTITHLILNETEAAILCGEPVDVLSTEETICVDAERFLRLGVQNVVITLGKRGAFYASNHPVQQRGLVPGLDVSVVDTTAAGDTFVGAYAVQVVQASDEAPFNLRKAVEWANLAAAKTVQRKGAQNSIPWLDDLDSTNP